VKKKERKMNHSSKRAPLSGLEKLMLVGLVGVTIGAFGVEQTHKGQTEIIALVFVALPLVLAGLVFARIRWMPAVAAAVAAIFILGAVLTAGELSYLIHPAASWAFAAIVVELLSCVLVLFAGIGATVRHNGKPAS
jgi:FtsH-binding integral membrane protein